MSEKLEKETFLDGQLLAKMAQGGAAQLRSNAEEVNKLNVFPVPDGDTGDNMRMTIESGIAAIENSSSNDLADVMKQLSHGMLLGARGNSGVILSQFFAGVAKGLDTYSKADARVIGDALTQGVRQAYSAVMTPTEGTILTVAREAVEFAVANVNENSTIRSLFADIVKEMYASLQRTPEILTVLKEAGVVDSGGAGLFYIMDGFYRVLNGEEIKSTVPVIPEERNALRDFSAFGPDSEMVYGYCTEFLLQLQNSKVDLSTFDYKVIPEYLKTIGDSIVAYQTDSIVKVHVHTLTPEKALAFCRQFGEFLTMKIENMSLQHNESEETKKEAPKEKTKAPHKKYATVTVCNGDGVKEIFTELGADCIVDGGQTQNPSTNDFLDAFEQIDADHIYVFPNNGNIIMAASQAAQIYEGARGHVIETKHLGAGYVALAAMNPDESDPDALADSFREAIANVATGYISPSIRDADLNGIHISNGDFIGFVNKEMLVSEPCKTEAAEKLAEKMLAGGDKFMFTVFYGKDASAEDKKALEEYISASFADVEAYFLEGGQDIYPFIFVAE